MVAKRKGSDFWYTDFKINGARIRESTGTTDRELAEQYEARRKQEFWRQERIGERPDRTWADTLIRYLKGVSHQRSIETTKQRLATATSYIGVDTVIRSLTRARCGEILDQIQEDLGISSATRNRYAAAIQVVLNHAHTEWDWLEYPVKIARAEEEVDEPRWLTHKQADALIDAAPEYWRDAIIVSLSTGLRQSNVMRMEWSWVDLGHRRVLIPKAKAKGKRTIAVPLDAEAVAAIRAQAGKHPRWVFPKNGKKGHIYPDYRIWANTIAKANERLEAEGGTIDPHFRWHDLRHTWASWSVMAGVSESELMELGGWRTRSMVDRYAHLSVDHLHAAVERRLRYIDKARGEDPENLVRLSRREATA